MASSTTSRTGTGSPSPRQSRSVRASRPLSAQRNPGSPASACTSRARTWPRESARSVGVMPFTDQPPPSASCISRTRFRSSSRSHASRTARVASCTRAGVASLGFIRAVPSTRSTR